MKPKKAIKTKYGYRSIEWQFCDLSEFVKFQNLRPLIKSIWPNLAYTDLKSNFKQGCLRPKWPLELLTVSL